MQFEVILSQAVSESYFLNQSKKLLFDAGKDWESLTNFGSIRQKRNYYERKLKKYIDIKFNNALTDNYRSLSGFGYLEFKDYYAYWSPIHQSRNEKENSNVFHSSFFIDHYSPSGMGFKNNWANIQIGNGREGWGAGNDIQLALSEDSESYNYFLLGSNYGKVRVKYIYGHLENVNNNVNRYITARGIELSNHKSILIGLSETVIYSGENRSFDIGYLNPISSHLEIELNDRLNIVGNRNSNAVWQIHIDYLVKQKIRLSLNYLYDEFVLDTDVQSGKENGKAYSFRVAYTPSLSSKFLIIIDGSLIYVGTPTFRHGLGTNNFVQNGRPLGWIGGSDGIGYYIGANYFNYSNLIVGISVGLLQIGEESIVDSIFKPYKDYIRGPFPSGQVDKFYYTEAEVSYLFGKKYSLTISFRSLKNDGSLQMRFNLPFSM